MSGRADDSATARDLWRVVEPIHAVVYFAPEVADAVADAGVVGWWTGYVAGRAAPLGACGPELVRSLFHGFAEGRISKAVPAVWHVVEPARLLELRRRAVADALARIAPAAVARDEATRRAVELLRHALEDAEVGGRALYAAHASLQWPDDPVVQLWHACTLLREHRGDGHVAALTVEGLDGLTANLLAVAAGVVPDGATQRRNRGWSVEQWHDRGAQLVERGLVTDDGDLTVAGAEMRRRVEAATDAAASGPVRALGPSGYAELLELLAPWVASIEDSGTLEYPNAMGVTRRPTTA